MRKALRDIFEALGEPNMCADDAKLHLEKLDTLLSRDGIATIYGLASWLKALGLQLTVAVDAGDEAEKAGAVSVVELVEVAKT